ESKGCKLLIDAYGDVYTYLRTKQITHLDYILITHGDLDHYGSIYDILEHVEVDMVVINVYEAGDFYDSIKDRYKTLKVEFNDQIRCQGVTLDILGPLRDYRNNNNNSIVFKTQINGTSYLFSG